jgi:hypothetical protein
MRCAARYAGLIVFFGYITSLPVAPLLFAVSYFSPMYSV